MSNNLYETVSSELAEYRDKMDLTQEQLAEMVGISQSHYAKLENGQRLPSLKVLYALSQVFGVKMGDIIEPNKEAISFNESIDEAKLDIQNNISFMLKDKSLSDLKSVERIMSVILEELSKPQE